MESMAGLETQFFRMLNGFMEPAVRAGLGSPGIWPTGLVVLENTGRRSGRVYRVPVAATVVGHMVIASTVRGERSQWLKNLAVTPAVRYWLAGREREATAIVFSPNAPRPSTDAMPTLLHPLLAGLALLSAGFGMGFAVLIPSTSGNSEDPS